MAEYIKFVLNGCDISFTAEAPKDITLEQLLKQCDRIQPHWCACGICSYGYVDYSDETVPELRFDYDDVVKDDDTCCCDIKEKS